RGGGLWAARLQSHLRPSQIRKRLIETKWTGAGAVGICVGMEFGAIPGVTILPPRAASSMILSEDFLTRLRQPSALRIVTRPEASKAQNDIAAVSAEGR